ncbi:hypothetical protein L1049_020690 [Liquidambar formosana]|uniref:Structural maintenance of chromosomes flexible hinge domain-containing protein GMI1 n=1 Tax=Liquidambar formosana TaxID=63359 RepID=A0AAP0SDH0_LIQFO
MESRKVQQRTNKRPIGEINGEDDVDKVYKFKILLPNGTSLGMTFRDPQPEMPMQELIHAVKMEYLRILRQSGSLLKPKRDIMWDGGGLYLEENASGNKIRSRFCFKNFKPHKCHLLTLHDGSGTMSKTFQVVVNLSCYLFVLIVNIDEDRISIFDTGPGMDSSDENSLVKWYDVELLVEIYKLKMKRLDIFQLQCKLKDIYFPYIQCDEVSKTGKTMTPIEFQVNGVNLAEVEGGEVATTNLHSCNGPDFVLQLRFYLNQSNAASNSQGVGAYKEANARLKCVYFPVVEGKENIERILENLEDEGCGIAESYETFSRVSIRRLGRLLPDARWALLPFMELTKKKAQILKRIKRCCFRVKCFIETDAGFKPTTSKNDLALHHHFTAALKNFGNKPSEKEKDILIDIDRDGRRLDLLQLEKEYQDWIFKMHDWYDEEVDCGEDPPVLVVSPNKMKLAISSDVVRVHQVIRRKGTLWKSGQKIKILKGACAGCHKNNVYAILEYILLEGFQGDAGGDAQLICRPLGLPNENGCDLSVTNGNANLDIRGSFLLPISVIDSGKCLAIEAAEWDHQLERQRQKAPSSIDVLNAKYCEELEIDGALPVGAPVYAGHVPPKDIVAVVRPACFTSSSGSKNLDQKYIIKDNLDMSIEVKYKANTKDRHGDHHIYSERITPSSHKGFCGLYIFPVGSKFPNIFQKAGAYTFSFSLKESSVKKCEKRVLVKGSSKVGRWELLSDEQSPQYKIRVGACFPPFCIGCYDIYDNHIPFKYMPQVIVKLNLNGAMLAFVEKMSVNLSSNKMSLIVKDLLIESSELDTIQPSYEATLAKLASSSYRPNTADDHGYVDLSGLLKVTAGYGESVSLSVISDNKVVFKKEFQTERRLLRTASRVPEFCIAGSQLKDIVFEIVNAEGDVDETIHDGDKYGQSHTLTIKAESLDTDDSVRYIFRHGRCMVPAIPLPQKEGNFFFVATHSHHPEIHLRFKVSVGQAPKLEHDYIGSQCSDGKYLLLPDTSASKNLGNLVESFMNHEKELVRIGLRIGNCEKTLEVLNDKLAAIEQDMSEKKASLELGPSNPLDYNFQKDLMIKQIESKGDSAAAVVCNLDGQIPLTEPQILFKEDIFGLVALLGAVRTSKLSRILAEYLGEDQMLAVVCRSYAAADALEKYEQNGNVDRGHALYSLATALGKSINGRFLVMCLEDIRPYMGDFIDNDPQRKLALPSPTSPTGEIPLGFLGYAVNMIDIHHLGIMTSAGNGLRETLFYRLFGDLQVYETREHMKQARACIKHGAVSLDGGIARGDGVIYLGCCEPEICFPVITLESQIHMSPESMETLKQIEENELELRTTRAEIARVTKIYQKAMKKYKKRKDQYEKFLDQKERHEYDEFGDQREPSIKGCYLLEYRPNMENNSKISPS